MDDVVLLADLALRLSSPMVRTQATVCVPLTASASAGLLGLGFTLTDASGNASNLVFNPNPRFDQVISYRPSSNSWYFYLRTSESNAFRGDHTLGTFCLPAAFAHSTFIPLVLSDFAAMNVDGSRPVPVTESGRITLIANDPILEVPRNTQGPRRVTLCGKPGSRYELRWTTNMNLPFALWQQVQPPVTLTGFTNDFVLTNAPGPNVFFRACEVAP